MERKKAHNNEHVADLLRSQKASQTREVDMSEQFV